MPITGAAVSVCMHKTHLGDIVDAYSVTNATLSTDRITDQIVRNLDISFTIRNLFNTHYAHAAPDYAMPLVTIAQDPPKLLVATDL